MRQNRDTLYSTVIVDISDGADLTIPDVGDRYLSVMVVNQDHNINRVFHDGGIYHLSTVELDTPYVLLAARILVDPEDAADVAVVNALQDEFAVVSASSQPLPAASYDEASQAASRDALLELKVGESISRR